MRSCCMSLPHLGGRLGGAAGLVLPQGLQVDVWRLQELQRRAVVGAGLRTRTRQQHAERRVQVPQRCVHLEVV